MNKRNLCERSEAQGELKSPRAAEDPRDSPHQSALCRSPLGFDRFRAQVQEDTWNVDLTGQTS